MRIGVLTTSFPRTHGDIAGSFVLGFSRALAAQGHTLEVLAPEPAERITAPQLPGVSTHWVPYLRPRSWQRTFYGAGVPDNLRRDARAWLGVVPFPLALMHACAARQQPWDALMSHWALPCALVAGHARKQRPHLAVLHSADVHLLTQLPFREAIASRIARDATSLWFVAPQHRDTFMALLPSAAARAAEHKLHVSPMGIDAPVAHRVSDAPAAHADRQRARRKLGLDRFSVLALGRLVPIKALDVAIAALAGSDNTLLVAGTGPERETLAALARAQGVDTRFLGTVTGAAKTELFAAADAFVVPSRRLPDGRCEGVPTALLEAMAHALPVVATRTGGMPSVVDDRCSGLLIAPDDPAGLAAALRALRDDPGLGARLGQNAAATARRFSWPALAADAERFLRSPGD